MLSNCQFYDTLAKANQRDKKTVVSGTIEMKWLILNINEPIL